MLISLIFISHWMTVAISSPWSARAESSVTTPWGHSDRKESRENFFKNLNDGSLAENTMDVEKPAPRPATAVAPSAHESEEALAEDSGDLSEIPWDRYSKEPGAATQMTKNLLWPIKGGRISSGYGLRNGNVHEGIDIKGSYGNLIRATSAGRVVYSGNISGYGKVLVIYHGGGMSSVYAHNSAFLKLKGSLVKKGEPIARVGTSGRSTGSHCHFEIRENGVPTNPLKFSFDESPMTVAER
ncbi:MAG: M23 family metallopeptidase [Deltaproteobacteria bacterium]|nr:M23 family metallopeptidase [Deltaproteobacteria bacterium]